MPKRTTLDWALEAISLAILAAIFATLALHWSELPDRVPLHYGISGQPNGWGGKNSLWIIPISAAILYGVMTLASRFQGFINLPFTVDRKSPEVRRIFLSMSLFMKATLLLTFAYINQAGINTALGRAQGLGRNFAVLFLVVVFCPLIFFTRKLWRYRT